MIDVRCMSDIRGLPLARRALEVAAAGGHHVLLIGPPGTGKTMLAFRFPGLLPPLDEATAEEARRIHHLVFREEHPIEGRPFRAPHHTVSAMGLSGTWPRDAWMPRPGELSLAHGGVLFLDDLPEFSHACLGALREPLETGAVSMWSSKSTTTLPAKFQLIATMTACPCGYLGHPERPCTCLPATIERYQDRVRPLARFFDIAVDLTADLTGLPPPARGEGSAAIRERVTRVRAQLDQRVGRPAASVAITLAEMEKPGAEVTLARHDEADALRSALTRMLNREDADR